MKKLISFLVLSSIMFLSGGAGCSEKNEDPTPDNFLSMLGKWRLEKYVLTRELTDGSEKVSLWHAKDHAVNIVWDFKSDGVFKASYGSKELPGNWDLKVQKGNAEIINNAILTLSGQAAKEAAQTVSNKDILVGKLTAASDISGTYFIITYDVDVSLGYTTDGKKITISYTYRKI
ncbi:hypothetical protein [Dyadobacter diqingensis]|uniref:hypothetical protein n=1 Tax=Dyadobacter diqingensis TaxID=2938121 RepID=UPI0020C1B985|nr:hypothetical protein [Dyadobacter diqingensis]